MSILSNLDLIRRVPLFSTLTQAQAESVADAVIKRRFKRGECIVEQGKKSNFLAIVLTGRARVVTTDVRGREVILATMNPGDYVGEMSLIDNQPHFGHGPCRGADRCVDPRGVLNSPVACPKTPPWPMR